MRRKIACYITGIVTALFMVLRIVTAVHPDLSLGFLSLEDAMIALTLIALSVIAILCFSKTAVLSDINGTARPFSGWCATFCGALLIMSVILDTFCWVIYNIVPPPSDHILNNVDRYCLIFSLLFGAASGIFMILQGFSWMAGTANNQKRLSWLSIAPILWMWFRLARYEISYASTIDISHSFFEVASLVTASLFFLQLSRAITMIGAQPKNGLIVLALSTTICSLSGAPLTFYQLSKNVPISSLLIALVDATIGLVAFATALVQAFSVSVTPCDDEGDEMAWTTPAKERQPLDPPFVIDQKLAVVEEILDKSNESVENKPYCDDLSVDDILAELNKDTLS